MYVRDVSTDKGNNHFKAIDLVFHTGWDCHVWNNFKPGYTCWTTIIFGILEESSLTFNNLPLINDFSYRNVLQNGAKVLTKMVLKTRVFVNNIIILSIS